MCVRSFEARARLLERPLFVLGVEILDEGDAQFLTEALELIKVLVVLLLVLNFGLDAYLAGLG